MGLKAFLAVNAFFVSINLLGAAVMLGGGWFVLLVSDGTQAWPWFLVGLAGVAAAILFAKFALALIGRWRQTRPARARE